MAKPKLCILADPYADLDTIERLTEDGTWVPDRGETPSLAFSGKCLRGTPYAWHPNGTSQAAEDVARQAMHYTCDRYSCANGNYDVKVLSTKKKEAKKP